MKCDICGKEIYRKYYPFEGKKWCHACVEEHSMPIVEKKNLPATVKEDPTNE